MELNNREIAIMIIVFIVCCISLCFISKEEINNKILNITKDKKIHGIFFLLLLLIIFIIAIIVYLTKMLTARKIILYILKNSLWWYFFVGFPLLIKFLKKNDEKLYRKELGIKSLILSFIANFYVFPLKAEMIMFFFLLIAYVLRTTYKQISNMIFTIFGFLILTNFQMRVMVEIILCIGSVFDNKILCTPQFFSNETIIMFILLTLILPGYFYIFCKFIQKNNKK